jgi:hypothetical protein
MRTDPKEDFKGVHDFITINIVSDLLLDDNISLISIKSGDSFRLDGHL